MVAKKPGIWQLRLQKPVVWEILNKTWDFQQKILKFLAKIFKKPRIKKIKFSTKILIYIKNHI